MVSVTIRQNDPRLVAIKAELLYALPELTGKQINQAAFLALVAIDRLSETSKATSLSTTLTDYPIQVARTYQKFMSGDG